MNDFEEYIRQSEPHKREKGYAWQTAIGLQAVDGLKTSDYLIQTAYKHIEGDITIDEAKKMIDSYYQSKAVRTDAEDRTEEADKVSARITEILSEKTFNFSPIEYLTIHRRLFEGVYKFAGKVRDYNITKNEWVLNGQTVLYASADSIRDTLDYDFSQEKIFNYQGLALQEAVSHIVRFIAGLWQIHAFGEGNTRTTAVFAIKYLRTFGFTINNDAFAAHSWYFRNALVRANYNDLQHGVFATTEYLEMFFRNLLMGENNELKNRNLLVSNQQTSTIQSARNMEDETPKCNICTLKCTLEELAVWKYLKDNPRATQKEVAASIGKSERTIKTITVNLTNKGLLARKNGRRNGYWEVNENK
nr:Fic family protein [Prevotella sp.]